MNLPSSTTYARWLAVFRIVIGVFWLLHGIPKWTHSDQFMPPNGLMSYFIQNALAHTSGAYRDFLVSAVQPNIVLFANLVRTGEVCVGLSLLLGVFTRLGGFFGIVLALDYMSAKGPLLSSGAWQGIDACMLLLSAINLVLPTGRVFGVDALLGRRKRAIPAVKAEFVPEPPMTGPSAPTT